jgi:quaternary ammonium compound-resistance protein SugE
LNPWILLVIAGFCETLWVIALDFSESFTKLVPSILTVVFMALSILLLSYTLNDIPLGTAYAVWTAIGAVTVVIIGMLFLNESASLIRIFFLVIIIVGIVGLKLTTA